MQSLIQEITGSGRKALGYGVLVAALSTLIITTVFWTPGTTTLPEPEHSPEEPKKAVQSDPFEEVELVAESAYVLDVSTGKVLYEKNATERRPLASITKIMTAMTALDLMPDYAVVTIDHNALLIEGDNGLYGQERWTLQDLLDFSLVVSSNSGAGAIASVAGAVSAGQSEPTFEENVNMFVSAMNRKAQEIGLHDTEFHNPHGLDTDLQNSGSYSTARDTALMVEYALNHYPDLLDPTRRPYITRTSLTNIPHTVRNTNEIVDQIPGVLASKTGFTDLSDGNLVVAFDAGLNQPVIAVVLGSGFDARFSDMLQLVDASISSFSDVNHLD